jgi:hypothetical protein
MVHYQPTCGAFGSVTARTDGSSFTCKFDDVNEQRQSTVQLVATDANSSATFSLAVTLNPDNQPPVLTLPDNISVNSTSNAGATVPFSTSAQDAVSGAAAVSCTPQSGSQFPIGTTTVNCSAKDWKDNQASGHFDVVVNDVTPPSLTLPASQTLDATSPGGVTATFAAGAVDAVPATPPVSCQPPSGSMFAIGTTAVSCTASDKAGNKGSGQFNIKVRGAAEQLAILQDYVDGINTGPGKAISAELKNAVTALNADRNSECTHLDNIIGQATKPGANSLTPEQSGRIVSDVTRIKAVVGCTR